MVSEGPLQVADLVLDAATRHVTRAGETIDLTKLEFDLLELLIRNAGIVLSREVIYERIWGYDFGTGSKSLDVYVGYLRRKTEAGGKPRLDPHRARFRLHAARTMSRSGVLAGGREHVAEAE